MAPSQKTSQALLPRTPSSSGTSSSTKLSGAPDFHLSRPRWCPTSPRSADSMRVPALAGPALHSDLANRKADIIDRNLILLNPKRRKILTVHQRRQQLSLLLCTNGAKQRHQLMTIGTDHSGSGIGTKLICKPNKNGKNL